MFFTKDLRQRLQDVYIKSHAHPDPIPRTVRIPRQYITKGDSVFRSNFGITHYDVDKTYEDINIEDAIKMIVDHLGLKYEDGKNITPKLVKPRKDGLRKLKG